MRNKCALATFAMLVATSAVGCSGFLTGDNLSSNPNKPVTASADQLLVGIEVNLMANWEAYPMNLLPLWAQQIQGVQRQWESYSNYGSGVDNLTADGLWKPIYGSGGLADIRRAQAELKTTPGRDGMYGELQVMEALNMGTAADLWGNIPYDSAFVSPNAVFDAQGDVYAHVQAVLDSAITALQAGGNGAAAEFFFSNDFTRWIAAAHTLKARFYMHTAETGPGVYDLAIVQKVKDETVLGIADTAGSWRTIHSSSTGEQNLFYNFLQGARKGDVEPSDIHIGLAQALNDNVFLAATYVKNGPNYVGSAAGASAGATVSSFAIAVDQSIGIVTYAENILLAAEADYRLGNAGLALTEYNTERTAYGESGPAVVPGGANGLLVGILEEKYVRLFLNPEVFFDYLRTCVPNIPLPANKKQPFVQARLPYGYSEENTNTNFPKYPPGTNQPSANANFPKLSVDPSGAVCAGQAGRTG